MNLFILSKSNKKRFQFLRRERIVPGDEKVFGWDEPCIEDRAMLISDSSGLGQIEYRLDEIGMKKFLYTANSGKIVSGSNKRKKKAKVSVFTRNSWANKSFDIAW